MGRRRPWDFSIQD